MGIFGKKSGDSDKGETTAPENNEKKNSPVFGEVPPLLHYEDDVLKSFKMMAYETLMERIDLMAANKMAPEELRREVEHFIAELSAEKKLQINAKEQRQLAASLVDDMIGLGPLEKILHDDSITDILVNGPNDVYIERNGKLIRAPIRFQDEAHLEQIARRIASHVGRRVDESSPTVDARLVDGSRVNIIMPPLALDGTAISIRKFSRMNITLKKMIDTGSLSESMANLLEIAAASRLNILISGGTGSGKTTLLNALSQFISPTERIITIEDAAELHLQQEHVVRLESRPPNIEGEGAISIRELVRNALRMRPDRIILGEVRGDETIDMLQAMNTGHDGSMSTIHANRPREALTRLENMVMMSGIEMPPRIIRTQIVGAINLIVHVERMRDGVRRITEITEITGLEGEVITLQTLFSFEFQKEGQEEGKAYIYGSFKSSGFRPAFSARAIYYGFEKELKEILQKKE